MGHGEIVIAGLLVAVAGLSALARHLSVPYPIMLVVGGGLFGFVPGLPTVTLDPEVVLVADGGESRPDITRILQSAREVASEAFLFRSLSPYVRPALVNGAAGVVVAPEGKPFAVMGFTVVGGKIVEIDAIGDPERLAGLDLVVLDA